MSTKFIEEVWRQGIHNAGHDLLHQTQDIYKLYAELFGHTINISDKHLLVERQLTLLLTEIRNLNSLISRIESPKELPKDGSS